MSLTLVAIPDSTINQIDRALWLTIPFSLQWPSARGPIPLTLDPRSLALTLDDRDLGLTLETRPMTLTLDDPEDR